MKSQLTTTILDTVARMSRACFAGLVAVLAVAFWPSGAVARSGEQTFVFRSAAVTVKGFGVQQDMQLVPSPSVDGYVTGISADVVDENGVSMPISTVMLHHVVLAKIGVPDATCQQFYGYDGRSVGIPVERFFAEGEERTTIQFPAGYGYPNRGSDHWGLVYMLMNHKPTTFTAYVQYTVHYVTGEQLTPVEAVLVRREELPRRPDLRRPRHRADVLDGLAQRRLHDARERTDRRRRRSPPRRRPAARALRPDVRLEALHLGADLGPAGRQAGHPRARAEAHDHGVHGRRDPCRGRRPTPPDGDVREQPAAHPGDGDHARLPCARAGDAVRCRTGAPGRPALEPLGPAPFHAAARRGSPSARCVRCEARG